MNIGLDLQKATQLKLFDAIDKPKSLGLGSRRKERLIVTPPAGYHPVSEQRYRVLRHRHRRLENDIQGIYCACVRLQRA